jgi:hypothetical protein
MHEMAHDVASAVADMHHFDAEDDRDWIQRWTSTSDCYTTNDDSLREKYWGPHTFFAILISCTLASARVIHGVGAA